MRRETAFTTAAALLLLAVVPAYDRVFADQAWRGPALASAGLAFALAVLVRRLRGGAVAAALVSVAGLVAITIALHIPAEAAPSLREGAAALRDLALQGLVELRDTPAPAPALPGLMLIVTSGFWTVTHAVHELAVRRRTTGVAIVPAVVLWAAPLAVPMAPGRSWPQALPFLAAAGLALLLGGEASEPSPSLPATGVALGAGAMAVGLLAPALLPGYGQSGWVDLHSGTEPRGYQPIVDISRRLQLPEDRDVLRVHAEQRTYLRLAGLDHFDGATWRLGPPGPGSYQPDPANLYSARNLLPFEEPAAESEPVFVDVEVLALENIYVPVPYQPVQVLGPSRTDMVWSTDGAFLATWATADDGTLAEPHVGLREGMAYRVQAARPAPTIEQLREVGYDDTVLDRWTGLPDDYSALAEQAEEVYEAAGATTAVDRALALQDWFGGPTSGFSYDLDVEPLRGSDALERFVLEDKIGYCEYYATAMAVMLRATGIPARVAVGFLPGRVTASPDAEGGSELTEYTVSTGDAHAWVEVLFPGYGWITFEPTPRSDQTQIVPTGNDLAPVENVRERRARELEELAEGLGEDAPVPDSPELPLPDQQGSTPALEAIGGSDNVRVLWLGAIGVVALLAGAAWLGHWWRARVREQPRGGPQERVLRAQRRVLSTARKHGLARRPSETAREVVLRWHDEGRVDGQADRFANLVQAAAFGGEVDAATAAEAERIAAILQRELRGSVDARTRALAPVRVPAELAGRSMHRAGRRLRPRR